MQSALPPSTGLCNSTQQHLITPLQMMQPQHTTALRNHTTQVQLPNIQTTSNSLTQSPAHHQYDISFPPLSEQNETLRTKVEYKKRPRDSPENHMQTTKQRTLNDYWVNQTPPSNDNKLTVLMDAGMEEEQTSTQQPDHPQSLWREFKTYNR
jgi:hypothetical protein